jgi:hypothetical protein
MQKALLSVAIIAIVAGSANAAVVYSRTAPIGPASRVNFGNFAGSPDDGVPASTVGQVHWEDVGLDQALIAGAPALEVTKITIAIRRSANAPANSVNLFWSQYNAAATNTVDLLGAPLQPGGVLNSAGSINLPARAAAGFGTELYTLGDGVTPLFTTGLVYGLYTNTSIGGFGLGLQFGNNTPDTSGATPITSPSGWVITPDSGQTVGTSANLLWVYDPQQVGFGGPGLGAFNGFGVASGNSMYLIIEGNAVPTPGALAIAGLGGLLAARRRR